LDETSEKYGGNSGAAQEFDPKIYDKDKELLVNFYKKKVTVMLKFLLIL
jgi:hypothetical protein